jgi:hypothetical protein
MIKQRHILLNRLRCVLPRPQSHLLMHATSHCVALRQIKRGLVYSRKYTYIVRFSVLN